MNDKHDSIQQDISALLDGELDDISMRRLLNKVDDSSIRDAIQRQSQIQSLLNAEAIPSAALSMDISAGVRDAISNESQQNNQSTQRASGSLKWLKPMSGLAVAASLAFVMVFTVDYWQSVNLSNNNFADSSSVIEDAAAPEVMAHSALSTSDITPATHVSFAEEQSNSPYDVAVAASHELEQQEAALLKAHQENAELQKKVKEYLAKHPSQKTADDQPSGLSHLEEALNIEPSVELPNSSDAK